MYQMQIDLITIISYGGVYCRIAEIITQLICCTTYKKEFQWNNSSSKNQWTASDSY